MSAREADYPRERRKFRAKTGDEEEELAVVNGNELAMERRHFHRARTPSREMVRTRREEGNPIKVESAES